MGDSWLDDLREAVSAAPEWMRDLASAELHIGGFTNVELAHPVLDAGGAPDENAAERALLFLGAASLVHGATIARVECTDRARARRLAVFARRSFPGVVARVEAENLGLLPYFDIYLRPTSEITARAAARLLRAVARALAAPPTPAGSEPKRSPE